MEPLIINVRTYSGSEYVLARRKDGSWKVTGGSRNLQDGTLVRVLEPNIITIGQGMFVYAPERAQDHPTYKMPGVSTSYIMKIEIVKWSMD
jgi:hypothetical protein